MMMSHFTRMSGRRRRAFTLIELLVVVAIIALLLSIVSPGMKRAVRMAMRNTCNSNMHQMGVASQSYAVANDGYLPRDVWPSQVAHYFFGARFSHYLGGPLIPPEKQSDTIFLYNAIRGIGVYRCPAVETQFDVNGDEFVMHYTVNGCDFAVFLTSGGYGSSDPTRMSQLPVDPSATLYLTEYNPNHTGQSVAHSFGHYDVWVPGHITFAGVAPSGNPRMIEYDDMRHSGSFNLSFFDGHAETRRLHPAEINVSTLNPLDTSFNVD